MQHKIKILHLEDLESDAFFVEKELQKSAIVFEKRLVDTKVAFVEALKEFNPDIVLSDHALPAFNSAEALSTMQELGYDLPFILVTGNVSEEFAVSMMKAGACDYILKDRMQRLPKAVINAYEKVQFKKLQQKYIDESMAGALLFKQAEKMAHFGTWKYDLVTARATWSEETYRLLGYNDEKVLPSHQNFLRHIIAEDRDMVKQALEMTAYHSDTVDMEFRVMMQDQSIRYICSKFIVDRNEENEILSVTGFNQDITEAKLTEASLYKSNANLQTIFKYADTAFILIDADFRVQSYNLKAELFAREQFSRSLTEGELALSYFPQQRQDAILAMMKKVLNGEKINYEIDYPQKDGTGKWFDVTWIPIENVMNRKLGLILCITDIEQRKAEEIEKERITMDLMHKNKDLEQFAYIVSHNLRSQLANIMGLSEVFKNMQEVHSSPDWKQTVQMLDESCHKLDTVIKDLNNILQVKHHLHEETEEVDLAELIENIKTTFFQFNSIAFDFQYDLDGIKFIKGFKSYLHSIFHNLISNSIKFRQEGKQLIIRIKAVQEEDHVLLVFEDNGRGIDMPKRKEQVFGLYKRFHIDVEGKGMGLFMVKTEVEAMGGSIDLYSEVNIGTVFTIRLPA